jgi:hypothetical protein
MELCKTIHHGKNDVELELGALIELDGEAERIDNADYSPVLFIKDGNADLI